MPYFRFALVGLAGLLLVSPALAQHTKPVPPKQVAPAKPTAPLPATSSTSEAPDDTQRFFRLSPEVAVAGQPFTISYSPAGTPLAGKTGVRAVVYQFDLPQLRWVAQDVALQPGRTAGELTGIYTPPANVGFLAFKFVAPDDSTDNQRDQGYFYMLRDAANPNLPAAGANAGYGLLRKPNFGYGIKGYFKNYTIGSEALFYWLSQELRYHPENGPALLPQFLAALQQAFPDGYQPRAQRALARALRQPNLSEVDWLGCYFAAQQVLANQPKADSLAQQIRQRFPQGYLVRQAQVKEINAIREPAQKLARWQAFLQAYPPTPAYQAPARYHLDYDKVYQDIILLNMAQKYYPAIIAYAPQLHYPGLINTYYRGVSNSVRPGLLTPAQGLPYATVLIRRIDSLATHQPAEYAYLSPQQWQSYHAQTSNPWRIHYAKLLTELGHYAQARPYAAAAQQVAHYSTAELNDVQAAILRQGGAADVAQLQTLLKASVYHNQATPRILDWLREYYAATHPGGAGYDQYLAGLQNSATRRAARAKLAKQMVKKPIADFALRDLDGQLVRLSAQRGKTVVLDFWATWCVPCKASFPGMKLAQERFKNDPKVVFYFIDIEETEPDFKQQIRDFLAAKKLPFRVLLDQNPPGAKTMDATYKAYSKAYHISGIPRKLIIDPQGNLRFLTDGYKGSPSELADEIEDMIKLARSAK